MPRITIGVTPEVREQIRDAAGGERKVSAWFDRLIAEGLSQDAPVPVPEPSEQPEIKKMRKRTDPEFTPDPEDVALQEAPLVLDPKAHVHRRVKGEHIGFDKGVRLYNYTCREPGCGWTRTDR